MRKPKEISSPGVITQSPGRMGTSFFDQTSLSVPSNHSFGDSFQDDDPFQNSFQTSSFKKERHKNKKKEKQKENNAVRNSLQQFLVASQMEDFVFQETNIIDKQDWDDEKLNADDGFRVLDSTESSSLFDRDALAAAGKSTKKSRRKKKRSSGRKSISSQFSHQQQPEDHEVFGTSLSNVFERSASETSMSLSDLRGSSHKESAPISKRRSKESSRTSKGSRLSQSPSRIQRQHGSEGSMSLSDLRGSSHKKSTSVPKRRSKESSRTSQGSRLSQSPSRIQRQRASHESRLSQSPASSRVASQSPSRIQRQHGSATRLLIGIRPRSSAGSDHGTPNKNKRNNKNDLNRGLSHIDRQVRRDRMKREYRSPSVTGGSISGVSSKSGTSRSYKRTGFEGGALNGIMGNENFAKYATRGGDIASLSSGGSFASFASASLASTPADEEFLKERKARQDKILDVALRQKWLKEQAAQVEAKLRHEDHEDSSHDEQTKKGLVKKMKKAVKMMKTAKISKSVTKAAANVVVDPKSSARRGYKLAPDELDKEPSPTSFFEPKDSTETKEKRVRSKKQSSSKKKGTQKEGAESLRSPLSKKAKKVGSPLSKKAKKGKTKSKRDTSRGSRPQDNSLNNDSLHASMSDMFPDFQLTEHSKVIWWDI